MKDVCHVFKMTNCRLMKNPFKKRIILCSSWKHSGSGYRDTLDKLGQSREVVTDTFTQTIEEHSLRQN